MENWIPITDGFIEADVIRWTESVFQRSRGKTKRRKFLRIGERQITAEVLREIENGGRICLLVRACRITVNEIVGRHVDTLKAGTEIRRAKKTILQGKPERLLWSEKGARDIVASKFLGPEPSLETTGELKINTSKRKHAGRSCPTSTKRLRKPRLRRKPSPANRPL